ncbi:MAG: aminoacyl-tRNA hydrolase [Gammaproteobacteria bacterium TMED183]|nr:aminoacyl-tRNA hydrolase [SAR116 cluster bacterium]OUW36895.1 MAG: aminoacyl-tRNA hydrolase [Gammaproteobacteria bacterium TMED183]
MVIIAGLGNPGPGYAGHRHNVGFMLLDAIVEQHGFSGFREKGSSAIAEGRLGGQKALLIKPLLFMNRSGLPVREVLDFYKLDPDALTVAHDDIDLAPGKVRVKLGGGHGGHNGLRDIDQHLGADYRRLRIGVGRSPHETPGRKLVDSHVLSDFSRDEHSSWLDDLIDCMAREIGSLYSGNDNDFATTVARLCPPPKDSNPTEATSKD